MLNEPAIGKTFFGRQKILGVLEKRASALKDGYRQNLALTGQMLSGKSSILYQFLYTLKDNSLIPVYIEVVEESFSSFADKFIATLLYNCLLSYGKEAKKDLVEDQQDDQAKSLVEHDPAVTREFKALATDEHLGTVNPIQSSTVLLGEALGILGKNNKNLTQQHVHDFKGMDAEEVELSNDDAMGEVLNGVNRSLNILTFSFGWSASRLWNSPMTRT